MTTVFPLVLDVLLPPAPVRADGHRGHDDGDAPASVPGQCGDEHGDKHGDEDVPPLPPLACVGVGTAGGGLLLPGGVDGDGDGPGVGADESEVVTLSLPASSILLPISCVPHHAPLLPSVPVPLELLSSALLIISVPWGGGA